MNARQTGTAQITHNPVFRPSECHREDNGFMPTEISVGETDDPYFIALLNSLVRGLASRNLPGELWVIKIDNWFDHKWLRFSGIGVVDFQWPAFLNRWDGALAEFHQDKVTFPPFTPNRIVGQWSFLRDGGHYIEAPFPKVPHQSEKQSSEANLLRRVQDFSSSACFVWYSGNTVANGRGSVMVYELSVDRVECWFASFNRRDEWKLQATKGASQESVQRLLDLSS
jgi:hypothetical protein